MWPDFIGIGSQRCGSTSLYDYICQHPEIDRNPFQKEVHYFTWRYNVDSWDEEWYKSIFSEVETGHIIGEFTPGYVYHPLALDRIHEDIDKQVKFLCLLRDPVDRAYSHYRRGYRVGRDQRPFLRALQEEHSKIPRIWQLVRDNPDLQENDYIMTMYKHSYQLRGMYSVHLKRWFKKFPRERFLFIQSERLFSDTQTVMSEVFEFLGVEPSFEPETPVYEHYDYPEMSKDARQFLIEQFKPYNKELFELLGKEFDWQ